MVPSLVPDNIRDESRYPEYTLDKFYNDNAIAASVFTTKYAAAEDYWHGSPNLMRFWERLAWGIASAEDKPEEWYPVFLEALQDFSYIFGGRIMFSLGRYGSETSLNNCYVNPIKDDSLYGIMTCLTQTARTYAKHGGVGHDISILRPASAVMRGSTMNSPGAVSFMDLYSCTTGTIAQDGRRGAEMISIRVEHPDVHKFVDIKNDSWNDQLEKIARHTPGLAKKFNDTFGDRRKVSFANISPQVTDEFMDAVTQDKEFEYWFPDIANCPLEEDVNLLNSWRAKYRAYLMMYDGYPDEASVEIELNNRQRKVTIYDTRWDGDFDKWKAAGFPIKVYRKEPARLLWKKIIHSAWKSAEPGVIFRGNFERAWTSPLPFLTTNPCGEIGLSAYEPCCLGHHNLTVFVKTGDDGSSYFDADMFDKRCRLAVRMQDNIHTVNEGRQALFEQEQASKNLRRLGIGITGLADMFVLLGIRYDSEEACTLTKTIMKVKNEAEYQATALLAKEKGAAPWYDAEVFAKSSVYALLIPGTKELIQRYGVRNIATSTVAPVGTGSLVAQLDGSGLEPIFEFLFERRVKQEDGSYVTYPVVANSLRRLGITADMAASMGDVLVTAAKVDLEKRVAIQGIIGKYTSNAISSTINLPKDISEEDIEKVYLQAYQLGLKGVTIYRDGSRAGILRYLEADEIEPGRTVARTPDELPALRIVRKSGKMKFYFTLSLKNDLPYELFIDTNRRENTEDTETIVDALSQLALTHGVSQEFIDDQLFKSSHQLNTRRIGRFVSLNLRHGTPVDEVVHTLSELPQYYAGSVLFHIVKVLAMQMPDGKAAKGDCPSCNATDTLRYTNGCIICTDCGYSKCS
jgi:ribonucleoside-diphosphate reductase alpha chain